MDLAKLLALFLTSLIATFSITFNYRVKIRSDDPAVPEREKLSAVGKIALLIVVVAGLFSIYSEFQSQRNKLAEKLRAAETIKQEALEAQKRQLEQDQVSLKLIQEMQENLLLIKEFRQGIQEPNKLPRQSH